MRVSEPSARDRERERARRRAEIFGDTLPEQTSDDRDDREGGGNRDNDAWLRAQVPPHHGG